MVKLNSKLIKHLRKALAFSQVTLAAKSGVSLGTLHQLEAGTVPHPNLATIEKLAEALEVDATQLLEVPEDFPANYGLAETLRHQIRIGTLE